MSKTYWRSLGELQGSEESRLFREREFPEGASELPEGITRREMLTLIGATLSIAGLASCRRPVEHIVPYVQAPEEVIPGVPRRYATTMPFGRAACGLVVESHEGRPTKIEGNELHPASAGKSSVRMQASILGLYDPDRSPGVLHHGERATWADFVKEWAELEKAHLADGGASLALLTPSFASPTLARLLSAFKARFPRARVATYESVSDENVLQATSRPLEPVLHLDKADVIVALDADLIGTDADQVRHIAGFAAGRARGTSGGEMNRLWSAEPVMSITGAAADHRIPLSSAKIGELVRALSSGGSVEGVDPRALAAMRSDLESHRGSGLVVAGPRQPAEVHAAVQALNARLGNVGTTVTYHEPVDAALPDRKSLADLVAALNAGQVATLVVLGGNPVYDAPADLDFTSAMAKAKASVALTSLRDETAKASSWHVPRAHFLESWGDARAAGGTLSVIQPMILPLYGGKSDPEVLGLLATGEDKPGYDLVRETWSAILPAAGFEKAWRRVLHDGLLPGSETPAVAPEARTALPSAAAGSGTEVVFRASPYVHDGRFGNDGWLQELPDQVTKLTWDNPALLSPATARALGVSDEDLVEVSLGGKKITLPAWIVPGQAEGTVVLTLGYGRTDLGRIADGVGCDVGVLRTSAAPDFAPGASIAKAGGSSIQAPTQEHGSMEGRPLVREAALEHYKHEPNFAQEAVEVPELLSLWNEKQYDHGHQWGMTIDLNTCVGCNACVTACQAENNIPIVGKDQVRRGREMHWIRVDRYFSGAPERPQLVFQPVPCMQCENAPCEQVCPVAATVHDDEGLNVMAYNRCIGTRYCSNNCPYKVRRFNFFNFTKDTPESLKLMQNPDVTVRSRGVMEKCTYCTQRINAAKLDAKLAGRELEDGDVTTACEQACPAGAITFGDLGDKGSRVVAAKQDPRGYAILAELNSKPRTTYLAKVRNPHPDLAAS
jgi:molybdopterin-containing oxidoreductase family iron-sulfur binding subunit